MRCFHLAFITVAGYLRITSVPYTRPSNLQGTTLASFPIDSAGHPAACFVLADAWGWFYGQHYLLVPEALPCLACPCGLNIVLKSHFRIFPFLPSLAIDGVFFSNCMDSQRTLLTLHLFSILIVLLSSFYFTLLPYSWYPRGPVV